MNYLDLVWVAGIFIVNVLYFIRKAILVTHGYSVSLADPSLRDGEHLNKIIEKESNLKKRRIYLLVNLGIPLLFMFSVLYGILLHLVILGEWR